MFAFSSTQMHWRIDLILLSHKLMSTYFAFWDFKRNIHLKHTFFLVFRGFISVFFAATTFWVQNVRLPLTPLVCLHLRVRAGRRKHLAARLGEDRGGRGSGNPPSPQVQCPHLRAKEKSSEYHSAHRRCLATVQSCLISPSVSLTYRDVLSLAWTGNGRTHSWTIQGSPLEPFQI